MDEGPERLPSLPARLISVFLSPGKLMAQLAREPKWVGALAVCAIGMALTVTLIPAELLLEAQREVAIERGQDFPEFSERAASIMRIVVPVTTLLSTVIFTFLFTGVYTVIFAFILGDEGSYKQYLAAVSHAWFIPVLIGLMLVPLRIQTGDPQFTLNVGSFLGFLPDGYAKSLVRLLDLSQIWATAVIAQGAHTIDPRRSFGSAFAILLVILVGAMAVMAIWV